MIALLSQSCCLFPVSHSSMPPTRRSDRHRVASHPAEQMRGRAARVRACCGSSATIKTIFLRRSSAIPHCMSASLSPSSCTVTCVGVVWRCTFFLGGSSAATALMVISPPSDLHRRTSGGTPRRRSPATCRWLAGKKSPAQASGSVVAAPFPSVSQNEIRMHLAFTSPSPPPWAALIFATRPAPASLPGYLRIASGNKIHSQKGSAAGDLARANRKLFIYPSPILLQNRR
jgi:hypothetical protein